MPLRRLVHALQSRYQVSNLKPEGTVQRSIEILIGRLVTDEDFRREFRADPHGTLQRACEWGLCLSDFEMRALVATDCTL